MKAVRISSLWWLLPPGQLLNEVGLEFHRTYSLPVGVEIVSTISAKEFKAEMITVNDYLIDDRGAVYQVIQSKPFTGHDDLFCGLGD